jgi:hypothetical protein
MRPSDAGVNDIDTKEIAMFRVQELTHFGTPTYPTPPQLPSAALVGAAFTQTDEDPFFAAISPTAMGYRTAPRGFADSGARRRERGQKALPTFSMDAVGRVLRFGAGSRRPVSA